MPCVFCPTQGSSCFFCLEVIHPGRAQVPLSFWPSGWVTQAYCSLEVHFWRYSSRLYTQPSSPGPKASHSWLPPGCQDSLWVEAPIPLRTPVCEMGTVPCPEGEREPISKEGRQAKAWRQVLKPFWKKKKQKTHRLKDGLEQVKRRNFYFFYFC